MTYLQEIQSIEAPDSEYRPQTEPGEEVVITIEFTPKPQSPDSEYQYSEPKFRFGDSVLPKEVFPHYQKNGITETHLKRFRICAMELVESLTPSGELLAQPYWRYGIRCTLSGGIIWLSEQALVRISV